MPSLRCVAALAVVLAAGIARADGDIAWQHRVADETTVLTANPLSATARAAFYAARGFSAAAISPYAAACGFSVGMQNGGGTTLTMRLADWYTEGADGRRVALRLPQAWDASWAREGVAQAARIAFRWAQFQAENTFEPGDWIMGMATLESRPAAPFRLVARYRDDRGDHEIVLERLDCAVD